jgi:hypothetical protein
MDLWKGNCGAGEYVGMQGTKPGKKKWIHPVPGPGAGWILISDEMQGSSQASEN